MRRRHPLTALRLLQVCGVNRFGHVIFVVPLFTIRPFAAARDAAVVTSLEAIQQHEVGPHSTHALHVGAGGASLHSLQRHGSASHLGTYYRIAEPLIARLLMMGGLTPRKAAEQLLNPTPAHASEGWEFHLLHAHGAAKGLHESFNPKELKTTFFLAPRGLVITLPGDPNKVNN